MTVIYISKLTTHVTKSMCSFPKKWQGVLLPH